MEMKQNQEFSLVTKVGTNKYNEIKSNSSCTNLTGFYLICNVLHDLNDF